MLELMVARMALNMMGYDAEIQEGVHANGNRVNAVVTDAEPKVVATVLPGARSVPVQLAAVCGQLLDDGKARGGHLKVRASLATLAGVDLPDGWLSLGHWWPPWRR